MASIYTYNNLEYSVNDNYGLSGKRLNKLIETFTKSIEEFDTTLAVRLDFSISTALSQEDCYLLDIDATCFHKLLDRFRKNLDRKEIKHKRNWKLESSEDKGLHLHTVYYFDYQSVQGFNLRSELYKYLKESWAQLTQGHGVIKLVDSRVTKIDEQFGCTDITTEEHKKQYSTILTSDLSTIDTEGLSDYRKEYLIQKNQQDKSYGFIHWISYLAKTTQKAPQRKCFG